MEYIEEEDMIVGKLYVCIPYQWSWDRLTLRYNGSNGEDVFSDPKDERVMYSWGDIRYVLHEVSEISEIRKDPKGCIAGLKLAIHECESRLAGSGKLYSEAYRSALHHALVGLNAMLSRAERGEDPCSTSEANQSG